ncbi:head morphogenesis protein [Psychrobacillus phage PVJ1]|nr:head morphogenesis protein [Psychrobacillus phage PVJ1]
MSKYWEDRALQRELETDLIAEKYMARMQYRLKETQLQILRDIETFYLRYAVDNQLTIEEAKRLLTVKDDAVFKSVNLEKFRAMAIEAVPENEALLKAISSRVRISRLEALNLLIEMRMTELYGGKNGLQEYAYTGLMDVYQNSYYMTMFDLAQGGIIAGTTVAALKDQTMKEILTYNWTDKEFSKRIWSHKAEVIKTVRDELEKSFSSGRSIAKTSKAISEKTNVVYSKAEALVRTEANFFHNYAARNSYEEAGVDEYEILATLDSRTSDKCQDQDGKIYKTTQYAPGKTAPPFHVRCRTTTVAYFDEGEYMEAEQRQSSGGLIDSMTYEEWKNNYVV